MQLLLTLLLSAVVNGAAIQKRDPPVGGDVVAAQVQALAESMRTATPKKAMKVEEITPRFAGAKRLRLQYGPYKLKAANSTTRVGNGMSMDKGGTGYQYLVADDYPRDVTVLETETMILDEKFQRADTKDGIYNHHNVFMDFTSAPVAAFGCEDLGKAATIPISVLSGGATEVAGMTFAAAKNEIKSGYYLTKDRHVLNMMDVVNYNNVERTVYISAEIEFLPGKVPGYLDARQQLVDPGLCSGESGTGIHPPHGVTKFSVNSTGIVVAHDGYIVNMRGHLHDGGVNIVFKVNNKEICNSVATYGGPGHTSHTSDGKVWETIATTTLCDTPLKVTKGDKIYMEAHYDLEQHPSREQGGHGGMKMGAMKTVLDGDDGAEQMALIVTHFAYAK
ncbi:hypothetical protein EJ06DRAFT_547834 [Trichodelitschia bisporula]|uniref:Uncharacterized protein n=1 Tax=Trichodelitschia bisporula TaxID=703511 RepID=A0A6G1I2Q0_9PEZI|nr:hypothetical protein EJ06DRAFT_547834 [Trichodelitschia bisporula]